MNSPEEDTYSQTFELMSNFIEIEKNHETYLSFALRDASMRNNHQGKEIVLSEIPIAIESTDSLGEKIQIIMEVENQSGELRIVGVLHAGTRSTWSEYSVLVSQNDVIEDFAETKSNEDFILTLRGLQKPTLKFISLSQEVIILQNIVVNFG